jgi:DNA-binding CsgD family transcriptional regulator
MTRQAKLGGDFSRREARRLPDGKLGGPDGGLRALASVRRPEALEAEASATEPERTLRAVRQGANAFAAQLSLRGEPAQAPGEAANTDDQGAPVVARLPGVDSLPEVDCDDWKRFIVAPPDDTPSLGPSALSLREREALRLALLPDITNKVIAFEMGISASTVGVLLCRAKRKLGGASRSELLARFRELPVAGAAPEAASD